MTRLYTIQNGASSGNHPNGTYSKENDTNQHAAFHQGKPIKSHPIKITAVVTFGWGLKGKLIYQSRFYSCIFEITRQGTEVTT